MEFIRRDIMFGNQEIFSTIGYPVLRAEYAHTASNTIIPLAYFAVKCEIAEKLFVSNEPHPTGETIASQSFSLPRIGLPLQSVNKCLRQNNNKIVIIYNMNGMTHRNSSNHKQGV
jgi:hypothetical protein